MEFQAISWYAEDVEDEGYVIKCFGRTAPGKSVALTVTGFRPYFYLKVPDMWNTTYHMGKISNHFVESFPEGTGVKRVQKKDFWGFSNEQSFNFFELSFPSHKAMKQAVYKFGRTMRIAGLPSTHKFQLYESNIEPYLRFIHARDLNPCGWMTVTSEFACDGTLESSCSDHDIQCEWRQVSPAPDRPAAPFIIASFDIECTSSGGEFPVPKKTYRRLATQLVEIVTNYKSCCSEYEQKETLVAAILYAFGLEPKCRGMERYVSRVEFKQPERVDLDKLREMVAATIDDMFAIIGVKGINGLYGYMNKSKFFPALSGDKIIQIGTTFHAYGARECHFKHIVTLGSCSEIDDGTVVETCETEQDMLMVWQKLIQRTNPDIISGYNINGFDFDYMKQRAEELNILGAFSKLSRLTGRECPWKEQKLSSSALGDNILKYVAMEGRVIIDLMKVVQRDHKLDSYKLDHVAHHFTGENKNDVTPNEIFALQKGSADDRRRVAEYCLQDCVLCNRLIIKLEILANNMGMASVCLVPLEYIFLRGQGIKIFSLVLKECSENNHVIPVLKKDVSVGNDNLSAVYETVEKELSAKKVPRSKVDAAIKNAERALGGGELDTVTVTFSSVATAILQHVFETDFGVSVHAAAAKAFPYAKAGDVSKVRERLRIALIAQETEAVESGDSYEGAIVLDPKEDIYIDRPVSVMDFASLYPSCMQSENLSPDKAVIEEKYDNLPGVEYLDIKYDIYKPNTKEVVGERTCRFAQGSPGIIPRILQKLLSARKATRAKIPSAADEFQVAILDGMQNAYKVTANSIYGQIGARTSPIYFRDIAACTTATGRKMILDAKQFVEDRGANVVYGDTDSIFVTFPQITATGKDAIMPSINMAREASDGIKAILKKPHDLEYEKTFWPFILLSKKRYVGNVYTNDDVSFKQKSMGIVLKRRDNANIVKIVYGGIIERILNAQDLPGSLKFMKEQLQGLVHGRTNLEDLVVSKSLRADYKDPTKIAHRVLADRVAERDPGNAPQVNDRVPYIYITDGSDTKKLQGERIEIPSYVKSESLTPDYAHYITNQIMKPVIQVYALVAEQLPGFESKYGPGYFDRVRANLVADVEDADAVRHKLETIREVAVKDLLFDPILRQIQGVKIPKSLLSRKYGADPDAPKPEPKPRAPRKPKDPDAPKPEPKPRAPRKPKDQMSIKDFIK